MTHTDPVVRQPGVSPDGANGDLNPVASTWFNLLWNSIVSSSRQKLKDQFGKAVDPQWIDKLTDQQALKLLETVGKNPESTPALIQAGMQVDDVIALAPEVSADEAKKPDFSKVLKERLDTGVPAAEAVAWAHAAIATPQALKDPAFAADVADMANGATAQERFTVARARLLARQLGIDEKLLKDVPPEKVERLLCADQSTLNDTFSALKKAFGDKPGPLLSELAALKPDQLDQLSRLAGADAQGVQRLHQSGQTLDKIAQLDSSKFTDQVRHADAQALLEKAYGKTTANTQINVDELKQLDDADIRKLLTFDAKSLKSVFDKLGLMLNGTTLDFKNGSYPTFSGSATKQLAALAAMSAKDFDKLAADAESIFADDGADKAFLEDCVLDNLMNKGMNFSDAITLYKGGDSKVKAKLKAVDKDFIDEVSKADPAVVQALQGAGMSRVDALVHGSKVSSADVADPRFVEQLKLRLGKKVSAEEALQWAHTARLVSADELASKEFADDLHVAGGGTLAERFDAARAHVLARRLDLDAKSVKGLSGEQVDKLLLADKGPVGDLFARLQKDFGPQASDLLGEISSLAPEQISALLNVDPPRIIALHKAGIALTDISNVKPEDMEALLSEVGKLTKDQKVVLNDLMKKGVRPVDAVVLVRGGATADNVKDDAYIARAKQGQASEVAKILTLAGMTPDEAARNAGLVTLAELSDPKFHDELQSRLSLHTPADEAVQWARTARSATTQELADPAFLADVKNPKNGSTAEKRFDVARQHLLARHLGISADNKDLKALDGSATIALLADDPATLKSLWSKLNKSFEHPLAELAKLGPLQIESMAKLDTSKIAAIHKIFDINISEIASLDAKDFDALAQVATAKKPPVFDNDVSAYQTKEITDPKAYAVAGGMCIYTVNGETHVVKKSVNPSLYGVVAGKQVDDSTAEIDKVRKAHGLPSVEDLSPVGTLWKDDNDRSKGKYSIDEQAFVEMIEAYRKGVEDKTYSKDSPQARLVRFFDYKLATSQGYQLIPYTEEKQLFGTKRTYPNGKPEAEPVSAATIRSILSQGKINKEFQALMSDKDISADLQKRTADVVAKMPEDMRTGMANRLHDALTSKEYAAAMQDLRDSGHAAEAEQMLRRDLANLNMLDPKLAQDAGQQVLINATEVDFQNVMDHPENLDPKAIELATNDSITNFIQLLRSGSGIARHGSQTQIDFAKLAKAALEDKAMIKDLSRVIKNLMIGRTDLAKMSLADLNTAMEGVVSPANKGKITEFFHEAQKIGVWGSIAGAAALASFGYKVGNNGAFGPDSTPMERWSAARDLISFLSVSSHMSKSFATFVDWMKNLDSKDAASTWKLLGLDRTLPEVWGKTSFLPQGKTWPGGSALPSETLDIAIAGARELKPPQLPELNGVDREAIRNITSRMNTQDLKPLESVTQRVGVSVLKVLGTVTDLVNVADLVLGAMGLDKAIQDHDGWSIATSSLQISSAIAGTGAAAIGVAQLFAPVSAALAGAAAPLFLASAAIGFVAFLVADIAQTYKRDKEWHRMTEKQGDFFQQACDDGVAVDDWGDRLEYLRYAYSHYGHEDTDPQADYFKAQEQEWEHFHKTPGKGGSSNNRLDRDLHHSNDKTKQEQTDLDELAQANHIWH